ncbi:MAG TPA: hypothetical protein VF151_11025 [Gemmatimonadales bacterium]
MHDVDRLPHENLEPLPSVVQEAIDSYARYYAEHHKLGMSVRDDMRYIASLAIRWAPERAASAVPDLKNSCTVSYPHQPHDGCDGRAKSHGPDIGWRTMDTAPLDGTEIEILFRHSYYWLELKMNGREKAEKLWQAAQRARWIDHNGGGWTWHGMAGVPLAWRPIARTASAREEGKK